MDKITFESVMEEIKKSLGEARLQSIDEYLKTSDDESGPRKDMPGFKATPEPSGDSLYGKSDQDNAPKASVPAPKEAPKPEAPKPEAPSVKSGVGGGNLGFGIKGGESGGQTVTPPTSSAPKASTPAAPKPSAPAPAPAPKAATPAPKPSTPAPKAGGTSSARNDDETSADYYNKEAERNRAQGGKPLPNEFNIFGKKETPAPAAPAPKASTPRPAPRAATPAPRAATPAPSPGISGSDNSPGIEGKMAPAPEKIFTPKGPAYNTPKLDKSNPNLRAPAPKFSMSENFDQFVKKFIEEQTAGTVSPPAKPGVKPARPSVANQPGAAKTIRNAISGVGENDADRANATQNVVPPGVADVAAGQSARPNVSTAGPSVRDTPAAQAKADQIAKNDAARAPAAPAPRVPEILASKDERTMPSAPVPPRRPATSAAPKPAAPAAPAKDPNDPGTPGTSAARSDDETNAQYWNKEVERNRAAGGKPLPNEFNLFKEEANFDQFVKKFIKEQK